MTDFLSLKLSEPLNRALDKLGYTTPTPIQQKAIPDLLAGRDLMGIAQTGTGKTAAFALPTLDHIVREERDPPKRGARVLVLAPTRELASQIAVSFRDYGRDIPHLAVTCVFGGVPISRQIKKVANGNDVLVATPGRLIDLIDRKDVRLNDVEVLILDEADQMMDMGFIHALRKIVPLLPKERQTLFFSATLSSAIEKLSRQFLNNPVRIEVSPANTTAEKVTQSLTFINAKEKPGLLALTLLGPGVERALVFTRTKHKADRLVRSLASVGLEAVAIHGNKSQGQRQRALGAFREGRVQFLIATDIAARGIDIEGISHVINYEIPNVAEQYVHRIGRTARASASGRAVAFVADDERAYLKDIQKLLKTTIPVEPLPEDFSKQVAALNARPALPKPDKPTQKSGGPRNTNRKDPKRPKRRKRAKTAEEELASGTSEKNRSPKSKSSQDRPHKDRAPKREGQPKRQGQFKRDGESRQDGQNKSSQSRDAQDKSGQPPKKRTKPSRRQRREAQGGPAARKPRSNPRRNSGGRSGGSRKS